MRGSGPERACEGRVGPGFAPPLSLAGPLLSRAGTLQKPDSGGQMEGTSQIG